MAHRALTPRVLVALRLAPSDGDVSAREEKRVRTQEGQKVTSQRPCPSGGLDLQTNMSVLGLSPGIQAGMHAVPIPSGTLRKPLGLLESLFSISDLEMVVTATSQSCF